MFWNVQLLFWNKVLLHYDSVKSISSRSCTAIHKVYDDRLGELALYFFNLSNRIINGVHPKALV